VKRREFLGAGAGAAVGLAAGGFGLTRVLEDEAGATLPRRPLPMPQSGIIRVAFLIGPHVNVIDVAGPWETFQDAGAGTGGSSPFRLFTVAPSKKTVHATAGLKLVPHHTYRNAPQPNVIVVPAHHWTSATLRFLRLRSPKTDLVMSVCTGAFILAEAGLLANRTATTHHDFFDEFESSFPSVRLVRGERFVEHDRVATAAGLTSGIDLALRVVERYLGRKTAAGTARYMEHDSARWREPS
jgi:transcriptional regulator GlxA family with amidase domain